MEKETEGTDYAWKTVIMTPNATIEIFSDCLTITNDNGTTVEIEGKAFEFLKDKMNGHV
jgi:hypothetical protein